MLITPRVKYSSNSLLKQSVKDLKGFRSYNRFIILSEVESNTIPDIIDLIFNLAPGGTSFLDSSTKKTKVLVINQSEVYGDVHGRCDTRTRNCYMHYGFADCSADQITGDTIITFTDMDWNVIADKPYDSTAGRNRFDSLIGSDINVSYDQRTTGGSIFRDTNTYNEILIPSPEFYDEKDMLLIGDKEENYNETLNENKSFNFYNSFDSYYDNLYRLTLNDLIDDHTKIFKLKITIENLSSLGIGSYSDDKIDEIVSEIASELKYAMETSGFSSGEIDIGGSNDGFNFHNLKSYLRMEKDERYFHSMMFVNRLSEISNVYYDLPFVLMFNMRADKVNVKIIDKRSIINPNIGTDEDSEDLSKRLKQDNIYNQMYA